MSKGSIFLLEKYWLCMAKYPQQTRHIHPMLDQCWVDVVDGGPALVKHWVDVSCLLSWTPIPIAFNICEYAGQWKRSQTGGSLVCRERRHWRHLQTRDKSQLGFNPLPPGGRLRIYIGYPSCIWALPGIEILDLDGSAFTIITFME